MSNRAFQPHIITDDSAAGGQIFGGSLKFNSARTNYLKRYVSVDGNKKKWTCSVWVKRALQGTQQKIIEAGSSSSSFISFEFQADDKLQLFGYGDSATQLHLRTSSRYRDTSGWYHIVVYIDSANSSAKLYVNGAEPPLDTSTQPTTNYNFHINNNVPHSIGRSQTTNNYYFDGYLSQFYLIDGQALDPSYFGYTDAATGIWRPKKYTYGNYGTNGFYLPFDGNSVPTDDQSGNNNHFTPYQMRPTVPLSKATGALPIMRTNKGGSIALTGVRDDPLGSNCVVAVPGHSTLQDYSYQVGASTYKSFTNNGGATISPEASGQIGNQCLYRNSIKLVKASTQWIEIPFSQFNLGTGDFTIECWAMHIAHSRDMNLFNLYDGSTRKFFVQARVDNSANDFHCRFYGSSNQYNSNSIEWQNNNNALNTWYHVAVCRASGTFRIFLNGVLVSTEHNTSSENLGNVDRLRVGYMAGDSDKYWDGFVQDIRFYNAAKYTSKFSVPSGNSTIVADSPSGVAVPRNFDYSVLKNGSVSLNKGNDVFTFPYVADFDLGSSWTIEFWFYPYDTTNAKVMGTRGDSSPRGWEIVYWNGGYVGIEQYGDQSTSGQQRGTKYVAPLAWHHIAITHNGTNTRTYIDGFADLNYTGSSGSNWGAGSHNLVVGRPESYNEGGRFAISNLRIVKGTVVYTTNFTPPTTPLTNITNTKLLCFQSPIDKTLLTVASGFSINNHSGTAGAYAPSGLTGGIDFPGSQGAGLNSNGMRLTRAKTDFDSDYTIEFWFNMDSLTQRGGTSDYGAVLFDGRTENGNADNMFGSIYLYNTTGANNSFAVRYHASGVDRIASATTFSVGTWYHLALVRSNGNVKLYVNGIKQGASYSHSTAMSNYTDRPMIGGWGYNAQTNDYSVNGKISNLRMASVAFYNDNFTPPTSNLTALPGTAFLGLQSTSSATAYTFASPAISSAGNVYANDFNPFDVADTIGQESGYCILDTNNGGSAVTGSTIRDGGLSFSCSPSVSGKVRGTLSFTKGKFYFEWTVNIASRVHVGVCNAYSPLVAGDFGNRNDEWGVRTDGYKVHDNNNTSDDGDAINDNTINAQGYIWMVAVDADNGKIYFGKNGLWLAGANPYTGTNAHYSNLSGHRLTPATGRRSGGNSGLINFGATPFVYNPPEGFKTICTSNIEDEPIIDPSQHFNVLTWTGNGSTGQNITGLKFKPDLLFIKKYNAGESWGVFDSLRGVNKRLYANDTHAEQSETTMSAFNQGGFRVEGSGGGSTNDNGDSYVGYCWRAGGGSTGGTYWRDGVQYTNKSDLVTGGIASQIGAISINTKAGFSIISFGGTAGSADLPHGLGKAPKFVLIKKYSAGGNSWAVYCDGVGAGPNKQILLNSSNAASTDNNGFNAAPDETFVHLGSGAAMATNQNGQNIAYIWAEIPGYSRFGTYYGNNNLDGTFIHCGFRPRFFLWKVLGRTGGWGIIDTERDPVNDGTERQLGPDDTDAQGSYNVLDVTSTGIKMRNQWGDTNQNYDHLFMAFAEQPVSNPYGGQSNAR
tara:strand:+ start:910 stop:5508 length:4599 start_codon:yes stop_codon:yes gene_type:complete